MATVTKAFFWVLFLVFSLLMLFDRPIKEILTKRGSNSVGYDWDRGIFITPQDTLRWMRNPKNYNTWILKTDVVKMKTHYVDTCIPEVDSLQLKRENEIREAARDLLDQGDYEPQ